MTISILEQITRDIVSWLSKVALINGYENDFTVERRKKRGNAPVSGQTLVVVSQVQPRSVSNNSIDESRWIQPYMIDIFVDPDESRETPVDTDINSARADAEIALAV